MDQEYRRRVGGLIDTANQTGTFVVWLGLPITKDGGQSRRWKVINRAILAEVEERPGKAAYVDMYGLLSDDGAYAPYLSADDGQLEKVRADDGVHLERAGGDIIASQVVRELRRVYDLWSWRSQ